MQGPFVSLVPQGVGALATQVITHVSNLGHVRGTQEEAAEEINRSTTLSCTGV